MCGGGLTKLWHLRENQRLAGPVRGDVLWKYVGFSRISREPARD